MIRSLPTLLIASLAATPAVAANPAHPTVIELHQSRGCSSFPSAITSVNALARRPFLLALLFAVTY